MGIASERSQMAERLVKSSLLFACRNRAAGSAGLHGNRSMDEFLG